MLVFGGVLGFIFAHGTKLTFFDIPMMNWLNGQSKRDPPLTALTSIFTYDLLSFNCGLTLNSQRLTGLLCPKISLKQPMVMLLHNQRLQTSDIQAFNFQHFFSKFEQKKKRESTTGTTRSQHEQVYIFHLPSKFSELVIPTVRSHFQKVRYDTWRQWQLQDGGTPCFSEVMVKLLLAAGIVMGSATFHPWMKEFHTPRLLQEIPTQCFSEVTVKLWHAVKILMDEAAFHPWIKDFHTSRFLQENFTQCFSEVMVKPLLTAAIGRDSVAYHPWMKDFHTSRFLPEIVTQCFLEVMVKLLLAAQIVRASATFHHWGLVAPHLRTLAMFVISHSSLCLGKTVLCKWIFFLRMMQALFWLVLDWMVWRCYDWKHKNLREQWMFAAAWLVNWKQTPRIFDWLCLMHACSV